jgi:GR25 family glycosyltransferase involved in LPS biosynthesis
MSEKIDIYVINLEERKDRWEEIQKNFKNFNLIRVEAIKRKNGARGCFLSHIKCLKIAKEKNLKNIIVIEDDCKPVEDFYKRLLTIKKYLDENNSWSIYLGGTNRVFLSDIQNNFIFDNEKFVEVDKGFMFHFICYNNTIFDFFLEKENNSDIPIDKIWHGNFNALVSVPFIAYQNDGFSNILNKAVSYNGKTMSSEKSLLSIFN